MSTDSPSHGSWLLIVNFHHVRESNPSGFPGFHHRTPAQLRAQLELLGRVLDFPSISAIEQMLASRALPAQPIGLATFDDGLRDHIEVVAPVLEALGIHAVFCVNTAPWVTNRLLSVHMAHFLSAAFSYPELAEDIVAAARSHGVAIGLDDVQRDTATAQYRFDDQETAVVKYYLNAVVPQSLRAGVIGTVFEARLGDDRAHALHHYLHPVDAKRLVSAGHVVGMHSHEHLLLAAADRELRQTDLTLNRDLITEHVGVPPKWISYPYGSATSYDDAVIEDARRLGCEFGMTMKRGLNLGPTLDCLRLRRLDTNDAVGGKSQRTWRDIAL